MAPQAVGELKADLRLILLVEDDADDVMLIKSAFQKAGISNPLQVAHDGEEAIAYLSGEGAFADWQKHPLPSLVLLDLRMPRRDGFDVLKWIKTVPELRSVVVIVLSATDNARHVDDAYRLGANSVLEKPFCFDNTMGLARMIKDYWLNNPVVRLMGLQREAA